MLTCLKLLSSVVKEVPRLYRAKNRNKNTQDMRLFLLVLACEQALRGGLAAGSKERAKSLLAG